MWKKVPNTDIYYASDDGQIKSIDHKHPMVLHDKNGYYIRKGRILKQTKNSHGYFCVAITYTGKPQKVVCVHRIIAETFIPNDDPQKNQINHIDGDKTNNHVSNLEWCTPQDNIIHAFKNGLNKGSHHMKGKTNEKHHNSKPVCQYDLDDNFLREYPSLSEASRQTGLQLTNICACCNHRKKTHGGYIWKFKN